MKIRIQGNSIRIRLSKSEVSQLATEGTVKENTSFLHSSFSYCLKSVSGIEALSASYEDDQIIMYVPEKLLTDWPANNIIGFEANMSINETDFLYLLLEKDFKCLDNTTEDQSDNFENPNKTC